MNLNNTQQPQQISKEERREEKRKAREAAERREKAKRAVKKIIIWLIVIGLVGLFVRWIINQFPKGLDLSQAFPDQGREHVAVGAAHPPYNSNPPTSGWHYAQPANIGFYDRELPDEQLVHNLEHGDVWIAYKPGLPEEVVRELKKFAGGKVIVTLRSKNESDIALAAWTRLDAFNLEGGKLDTQRIRNFILRYQNKGPEKVGAPSAIR